MKQRFIRFMSGRHGPDDLFKITSFVSMALLLITMFFRGGLRDILFVIAIALIIFTYFRVFSRKIESRREENAKYLRQKAKVREWFRLRRDMWKQRREYDFFKCPSCKAVLRVPRGKGKIRIVCKKCGNAFEKKT